MPPQGQGADPHPSHSHFLASHATSCCLPKAIYSSLNNTSGFSWETGSTVQWPSEGRTATASLREMKFKKTPKKPNFLQHFTSAKYSNSCAIFQMLQFFSHQLFISSGTSEHREPFSPFQLQHLT